MEHWSDEKLQEDFVDMLSTLTDSGWKAPVYVAVISRNGEGFVGVFDEETETGWEFKPVAEYLATGMMRLPINIMFVNEQGAAVRAYVGIGADKPRFDFPNN